MIPSGATATSKRLSHDIVPDESSLDHEICSDDQGPIGG